MTHSTEKKRLTLSLNMGNIKSFFQSNDHHSILKVKCITETQINEDDYLRNCFDMDLWEDQKHHKHKAPLDTNATCAGLKSHGNYSTVYHSNSAQHMVTKQKKITFQPVIKHTVNNQKRNRC